MPRRIACHIWTGALDKDGYAIARRKGKAVRLAAYNCEQRHGSRPRGYHAAHSCGNRACIEPEHVSWKTVSDNHMDKWEQGTMPHKLTPEQVATVKADPRPQREIAVSYGVSQTLVGGIKRGEKRR